MGKVLVRIFWAGGKAGIIITKAPISLNAREFKTMHPSLFR